MKALALLLATVCMLLFLYAVLTFEPNASQVAATAASNAAFDARQQASALREVHEATETCRLLLGWTAGTILRERDMAAFALCMHPTLKKHNLLTRKESQ